MSFMLGTDKLKLQQLTGGNLVSHPPLFSPSGELIFLISDCVVNVYSATTGLYVRELEGTNEKLISIEIELNKDDILIGCTEKGEVLRWKWSTGQLKQKLQLEVPEDVRLFSFNQLNWYGDSESPHALILFSAVGKPVKWRIFETKSGKNIRVPCSVNLKAVPAITAVSATFKNFAIAQENRIFFFNYDTWKTVCLSTDCFRYEKVNITCMKWHPEEEMLAVGDKNGRITLWHQFWDKNNVRTSLYHWHATPVTCLAFTQSGSGFYSSGMEAVLVLWDVHHREKQSFLSYITCPVKHIAVSNSNLQVAISTLDNGVQIVYNNESITCNIQNFTHNLPDDTGKIRFPVGLRTNPRANALVLNGRSGHLQFYSAYTKSLLYNMDIVAQNQRPGEVGRVLYDTCVTKAAFNIDWMATGEVYDDEEHFPELRLKFWKYVDESQSYSLNTVIELPHQGGFRAIEFSSSNQVNNLLCATVGEENSIKIWGLEETDNVHKKGKVWYCIAQTSYKHLPIESISFSQDGSLLAAGYGNTLCIFKSDSLKLKAALSCGTGIDGSVAKAEIRLPAKKSSSPKESSQGQRKQIFQLLSNMLDSSDETLIKTLKQNRKTNKKLQRELDTCKTIDSETKSKLFQNIMDMHQLNLFQKFQLFQRLGIRCEVAAAYRDKVMSYLKETIHEVSLTQRINKLDMQVRCLNLRSFFKAKYRLQLFKKRRRKVDAAQLLPLLQVLGLEENLDKRKPSIKEHIKFNTEEMEVDGQPKQSPNQEQPVLTLAGIRRVQFAANEYGHLVIACTESRVLVWNLLTLRIQNLLKLSVDHLEFDPLTNLVAAFTKSNELHVFQPNVTIPIYTRENMPSIYGATWLPRRYPKKTSTHVDWQAQSHLYFFTDSQELMYLDDPDQQDLVDLPSISFENPSEGAALRYTTFGTFATQQISDKQGLTKLRSGPLIVGGAGKSAVRSLVDMTTHTMPPLSLVCNDFMKALIKPADATPSAIGEKLKASSLHASEVKMNGSINGQMNGGSISKDSSSDEDSSSDDDGDVRMLNGNAKASNKQTSKVKAKINRKIITAKSEELKGQHEKHKTKELEKKFSTENLLKRISSQSLHLEF